MSVDGQDVDFHALRMTANRRMRQAILAHKTTTMTEETYDRVSLDEVMAAVKKVPTMPREKRQVGEDHSSIYSAKLCAANDKDLE